MNILFQNFYFKLSLASLIALLLAFAGDIQIFKDIYTLLALLIVLVLMLLYNIQEDLGLIMLLIALLIITYNSIIKTRNIRIKDNRSN
jgi:cell division protein FtsW (lipid II flippase)